MRLSTQQFFQLGSASISDLNSQTARLQQQISSGQRLLSASDDPGSASRIIRLESQLNSNEQFSKNVNFAESRLTRTEQAIASVETVIDRVRELVIQAGNGALDNNQRYSIAVEIEQRVDELLALTNTRDEQGDYIFSGFQTESAAYVRGSGGQFQYQGNDGVRRLQVDNDTYVATSETGANIFENIPIFNAQVEATASSTNSIGFQLLSATVEDREFFESVYPEDYFIQFQPETSVAPNGPNYSVTRLSDGAQIAPNVPYDPNVGIAFEGLVLQGTGSAPQPGDSFNVSSVTSQNMLNTIEGIAAEVAGFAESDAGRIERDSFIAASINNIDAIQESLLAGRARVGVSLNRLDTAQNTLADRELSQQQLLSDIRDLDYAEAISNLSLLTFVLEASQASFARISNLSLFNFIR